MIFLWCVSSSRPFSHDRQGATYGILLSPRLITCLHIGWSYTSRKRNADTIVRLKLQIENLHFFKKNLEHMNYMQTQTAISQRQLNSELKKRCPARTVLRKHFRTKMQLYILLAPGMP